MGGTGRTVCDILGPLHRVVRPVQLPEDESGPGKCPPQVLDRMPQAVLPPCKLLRRQGDGEGPPSLVVLHAKEGLA